MSLDTYSDLMKEKYLVKKYYFTQEKRKRYLNHNEGREHYFT